MSESRKKGSGKLILIIAAVAVAAAVLFYIMSGGSVSKEEVIERYRKELALLTPLFDMKVGEIDAAPRDREVTLHNVTFKIPEVPEFTLTVEKLVQSGIDADSYAGNPGAITTIDRQTFHNVTILMHGQNVGTLEKYAEENIALNYRAILEVLSGAQNDESEAVMLKLLPALKDYKVGRALAENFNVNVMFVSGSIESMEARDITMTSYGPSELRNFQVSAMGQKVFSLDKLGMAGVQLPEVLREMMADPEGYLEKHPDFLHKMNSDPFSVLSPLELRNFYLENLMVNTGSPLTVKSFLGDLAISDGVFGLKSAVNDLVLTREFMAMSEELAPIAEVVENDLHLSGNVNFLVGGPGDPVDVNINIGLTEAALGGFAMDMAMDMPREDLYNRSRDLNEQRIKSMEFSVDNRGVIDLLVAIYAAVEYEHYEDVYEGLLDGLYQAREEATSQFNLDAVNAIIKMIENGGMVNISFNPATPMSFQELDALGDDALSQAGFKVIYTPLQ